MFTVRNTWEEGFSAFHSDLSLVQRRNVTKEGSLKFSSLCSDVKTKIKGWLGKTKMLEVAKVVQLQWCDLEVASMS